MKKTILSLAAAAAVATAGIAAAPQPANALAWWVAPAIVAGAVGGVAIGAAAASANDATANAYYQGMPAGSIYVQPTARCQVVQEQMPNGSLRRVRVCD